MRNNHNIFKTVLFVIPLLVINSCSILTNEDETAHTNTSKRVSSNEGKRTDTENYGKRGDNEQWFVDKKLTNDKSFEPEIGPDFLMFYPDYSGEYKGGVSTLEFTWKMQNNKLVISSPTIGSKSLEVKSDYLIDDSNTKWIARKNQ